MRKAHKFSKRLFINISIVIPHIAFMHFQSFFPGHGIVPFEIKSVCRPPYKARPGSPSKQHPPSEINYCQTPGLSDSQVAEMIACTGGLLKTREVLTEFDLMAKTCKSSKHLM